MASRSRRGPWRRARPLGTFAPALRDTCGLVALAGLAGFFVFVWRDFAHETRAPDAGAPRGALAGPAAVVDGDTLEVGGRRVRLFGIDAPERAQVCRDGRGRDYPCGRRARDALAARIGGRRVACERRDVDRYGRAVAVCRAGGEDLNAWLVRAGWALAYRRYSTAYAAAEEAARGARRGLWAGTFDPPEAWRRRRSSAAGRR